MVTDETQTVHRHIPFFSVSDEVRALHLRDEKLRGAEAVLRVRGAQAEAVRDPREHDRLHRHLDALWGNLVRLEGVTDAAFWLQHAETPAGALLEMETAR